MISHPSEAGQAREQMRVIAEIPTRVTVLIPWRIGSTIVVTLAQMSHEVKRRERRSDYATDDDSANKERGEAHKHCGDVRRRNCNCKLTTVTHRLYTNSCQKEDALVLSQMKLEHACVFLVDAHCAAFLCICHHTNQSFREV
jgi:hypothetical protein